jgi:hypothetical protein
VTLPVSRGPLLLLPLVLLRLMLSMMIWLTLQMTQSFTPTCR